MQNKRLKSMIALCSVLSVLLPLTLSWAQTPVESHCEDHSPLPHWPLSSETEKEKRMEIDGHRGASYSTPENTRFSLLEAFRLGAKGAEFDLQMTKDHQIIILHDVTMERTAAPYDSASFPDISQEEYEKILKTPVQQLNFDQIKNIDIGMWKGNQFKGEKLITLGQALEILPPGKEYLVEVKGDDFDIIPHLKAVLKDPNLKVNPSSIKLIGFGLEVMKEIKKQLPEFKAFYILEDFQVINKEDMDKEIQKAVDAGLDGLDFEGSDLVTREVVEKIKKHGKMVITWVPGAHGPLDSPENAQRLQDIGVDIFTSNLPPEVMKWGRERRK